MPFEVKVPADGSKNLVLQVVGVLEKDLTRQVLYKSSRRLRLDSVLFAVQEKAGLLLWWGKDKLILPLESRGYFSFTCPVACPEDWDQQIWISSFRVGEPPTPKHFYFTLDCEKL